MACGAQVDFLPWLHAGHARSFMTIAALDSTELPCLSKLVRKLAERPLDLANASLLRLANKTDTTDIISGDRHDFALHLTIASASRAKAFHTLHKMITEVK